MTIRRTYHFNAPTANRKDGIYINDPCDIHMRQAGLYAAAPYAIDADSTTFLSLGDRPGYKPNSATLPVDIIGGLKHRFREVTGTVAPDVDDYGILCDTSGAGVTINLPAISSVVRSIYFIYNSGPLTGTNLVIINRNGTNTIDGATAAYLSPGEGILIFADSTNNIWRSIARRPRIQEVYKNLSGPVATTTSGSYNTLVTSGSKFFRGVPTLFILTASARDVNGSDEWWKIDYALRFDSGADNSIGGLANNNRETHEFSTLSALLIPPVGSHTVSIRWKRWIGAGTMTMDVNDNLILNCVEI